MAPIEHASRPRRARNSCSPPAWSPRSGGRLTAVSFLLAALFLPAVPVARAAAPVIGGLVQSQLEPELKGQVLIEELNCAGCHTGAGTLPARSKKAPRLAGLGSRVNPGYLERFLLHPHDVKPGTTMPDVLGRLEAAERQATATAITHFLLSPGGSDFALTPPDAVAAQHGQKLFHSRGCAACHSPRDARGQELLPESSVPLGALDRKYSFKSLVAFLRQPHATRPSGRMPDLRLSGQDIDRIAHYLLQDTRVPGPLGYTLYRGQVWEGLGSEKVRAERAGHVRDFALTNLGGIQHHTAIQYDGWLRVTNGGLHTFAVTWNGGSLSLDGREILQLAPSDRRGVKSLTATADLQPGWRKIQVTYFHTGREPKFDLRLGGPQLEPQPIPSALLSVSNQPIAALEPFRVDPALAAEGRRHVTVHGCVRCHDDLPVRAQPGPAWADLNPSRGCLTDGSGPWPRFNLNLEQRAWIRQALPKAESPQLTDRQSLHKSLVTFNCIACHDRAGLGGIAPERNALFTGTQGTLGDQGRLPPPLTHVGAKLQPDWIAEVLLRGGRQRDYVDARMPQFGEAAMRPLVELFGKVDQLEKAPVPALEDVAAAKMAGWEMAGTSGFSCIACHEFNGQKSGEAGAVDIARVTGRLQKNWFHLYLRDPARFHPGVIMPSYWPDGQSARPTLLGGDAGRQIEALWTYLADGPRAKKPAGLSRQSNQLNVGDVTEICRGRSPAGYRGIGVGYPERLNLAFDSEEMCLRQLWKGDFASVDPGSFNPRGTDQISFPRGIPFHRLASLEDNWPSKGKTNYAFPHDHGYQFRGYHLDAARRPTFLFNYGGIAVTDYFEDTRDAAGKAYFKRTLTFDTPAGTPPFHFRAAVGREIAPADDRRFRVDRLDLRITSAHAGLVRDGTPAEVLIPLALPPGRTTLTLEYQW